MDALHAFAYPMVGYAYPMVVACNSTGCVHAQTCPLFYWHPHPPPPTPDVVPPSNEPSPSNDASAPPESAPCLFFQLGQCSRGHKCPFSHSVSTASEMRSTISANGDNCPYLHDAVDLPSTQASREPPEVPREPTQVSESLPEPPTTPGPSPCAPVLSAGAAAFEPCNFRVTGRCVRGDSCIVPHGELANPAYSPIPSVSPLIPDSKAASDGDWFQISEELIAQASTYIPSSPSFFPQPSYPIHPSHPGHVAHDSVPEPVTLRPCKYFAVGTCRRGNACPLVHDIRTQNAVACAPEFVPDAETPLCRYQLQGVCRKGSKCRFRHTSHDRPPSPEPTPIIGPKAVAEEAGWLAETDDWAVDQQAASKWGVDDSVALQKHTSYSRRPTRGAKSNWRQEIDDKQWAKQPIEEEISQRTGASWFEQTGDKQQTEEQIEEEVGESAGGDWFEQTNHAETSWMQNIEQNPDWSADPQTAGKWLDARTEPEDHRQVHVASPERDLAEQSWDAPWPEAVPDVLPPRQEYCKFYGQGHCAKGEHCRLLHVGQEDHAIGQQQDVDDTPQDDPDLDRTAASIPSTPEPVIPSRSLYNCTVRFGPNAIPGEVVTSFESVKLILSNYPAGLAHADLLKVAEPYGVVQNTTFRLLAGGVQAHIEFEKHSQAAQARANLNGMTLDEMVLHGRLDCAGSVGGSVHDADVGRQIKLVWDAPSVSGWAFYPSVGIAKKEATRLDGTVYNSRKICAAYVKGSQPHSIPVRLQGLPLSANRQDLQNLCVGSSSVSLNPPNYQQAQNENIRAYLADFGPIESFEVLPTDPSHPEIIGLARFRTKEAAANAVHALKESTHDFLGKGRISAKPVLYSKYECSTYPVAVIRDELERLSASSDSACTVRVYDNPPMVHIYGRQGKSVAVIRNTVENVLFGSQLEYWDPYFDTSSSEEALKRINEDDSIHIRADRKRQVLRAWGQVETAEKQIARLLKHVEAKRHNLRLETGFMPPLIRGGLKSLQDEFGASKVLLDLRAQTLTVLGDIKTEVEARLLAMPPICSPEPGGCCLCFSQAVDSVKLDCEHIYCSACLQLLLCPVPGLDFTTPTCVAEAENKPCLGEIPMSIILSHLTQENQDQLLESSLHSFIRCHSQLRFCVSGCPVVYRVGIPGTIVTCPDCHLDLCASCAAPMHSGLTCEENVILRQKA
ncbi:hypothetical protein C8R46DRAFT_1069753 [Mycena filopes]|nr:hypothetical protein C8R46DRAFT_1069753 [Mycena filopes]